MVMRVERIGAATLYCGDALEIAPTLERPAAVISDPPYGMAMNTDGRRFTGGANGHRRNNQQEDARNWGAITGDDAPFDPRPWVDTADRVVLWGLNHFPYGLPAGTALVWLKRNDGAFGSFLSDAEIAWMKGGRGTYCFRDLSQYSNPADRVHPAQKPVSVMQRCIQQARVPPGGLILDPYMGAGSTILAAMAAGHPSVGIEIVERYFDIACRRVEAAVRQGALFVPAPDLDRASQTAHADLFAKAAE